jgi:hypothetical protein
MNRTIRQGVRALAAAGLTAATLAVAAPAQAHPIIDGLSCDSGNAMMLCDVSFRGTVGPVQIQWFVNQAHRPGFDGQSSVRFNCSVGATLSIKVVVTDLAGSASKTIGRRCNRIFP